METREIHVRVPVRIRLTGDPGPAELAALTRRLTALVTARLAAADRELARGQRPLASPGAAAEAREPYDPARDAGPGYGLPSYADGGRPAQVPVRGRAESPWTVVRTGRAGIPVERFLGYVEEVLHTPFPQAVLYTALTGTSRPVDVWLVRVDRPYVPDELGQEILARAAAGARSEQGRRTEPAWVLTGSEEALHRLVEADEDGTLAPRVRGVPPGHVLFAFMQLPRVDLTDVAVPGPGLSLTMTVREVGFCVDPEVFARAVGVPWSRYAEEFADDTVTVWTQPAVLRPASTLAGADEDTRHEALFLLFDRQAGSGSPRHEPAARLFVADDTHLPGLPEAVRRQTTWPPGEAGVRVLYCRADLDLAPERLGAAIFRPVARQMAAALVARFGDARFGDLLDRVLDEAAPHARGRFGSLFGHVLAVLEQEGKLGEFFDAADATGRFALRLGLLQQCEATPYARHPRVGALRAALTEERRATTANAYTAGGPGQGEIQLLHDPTATVPVGGLLGDADPIYTKRAEAMRPKPGKAEALRAELLAQRQKLVADLLAGREQRDYSEGEFANEVIERAARAAHVTADDFEKIQVEYGIRLLEVIPAEHSGLASYDIKFEIVSRALGGVEPWGTAAGPLVEGVGEFEARLVQWRLGRHGEVFRTINLAVLVVGGIGIALEAGIVALLVELGGGGTAVGIGIGLSEAAYLLKVLLGQEEASLGGFVMAAIDGYLGAVGFRVGAGLGGWAGGRIGTATLRGRVTSWLTTKLITGAVGGAATAGLETFAHDVVSVAFQDGRWSGIDTYVRRMEYAAVVGIVAEFTVVPVLRALLKRAAPTLVRAALLTQLLREEGVSAQRWAEAMALTRERMEQTLGRTVAPPEARAWTTALTERVDEAAQELGPAPRAGAGPHAGPEPAGTAPEAEGAAARPRPGPAARWQSREQLEQAALKDPEAGLDRAWYENASEAQLRAREAGDPVAKEYLDERWGGPRRPFQPDRPSDPALQERLRSDLREARAAVEAERRRLEQEGLREPGTRERGGFETRDPRAGRQSVPPTAKSAAGYEGTVAVARTDIPALAGERFSGGSPRALGSYDPTHGIRPPENVVVPQAHGHAEQDLGQQLDARLNALTPAEREAARGHTVSIRVDQEVCSICAAALGGGPRAGVLARLSARHPDLVFEVTADDTSAVYRIVGGRRVR
ncbi:hypothetical protein PUR57_25115 [Streptomyces sp. JV176]|uniref:hypothetical protein n=1 Tax=Streptomyces sp. JV176 TaxID=858630 RepID=UPI002E75A730|nr:hypothetical protein [Streptomyces sp. JV176]MEE1801929.1 hypothetical protein [Streptomyces sp. JV176]